MRKTCLKTIYEISKKDKKILFIGSDLGSAVMENFKKKFPDRFFMEGVAEQSIIGMAAGLAMEGFKPYKYYSNILDKKMLRTSIYRFMSS